MENLAESKADFVARGSRGMLLFCIATVFVFCGVCLQWLGAFGPIPFAEAPQDVLERGVITAGALLFGGSGLVGLAEVFRPPRELHIGPQGVYWSDWADEVIPWSEITRVAVRDKDQSRWFVLQLRDGSVFQNLYPRGRWRRLISRANRVWYHGKLWINMISYDRRYDEAYTAFETFSPTGVVFDVLGSSPRHRQ